MIATHVTSSAFFSCLQEREVKSTGKHDRGASQRVLCLLDYKNNLQRKEGKPYFGASESG